MASLPILALTLVGGLLVAQYVYGVFYALFFSPLKNVPGPFAARFTDFWHLSRLLNGKFELDNIALHKKHGPVVRYGPNRYSIQDAAAIKKIYGGTKEFPKTNRYEAFGSPRYHEWTFLADRDIARHSRNRRYVNNMYSLSTVVKYEEYVNECSDILFERLTERAGQNINMMRWFQCFAFDVISLMTYADRIGFLEKGEDVGHVIAKLEDLVYHGAMVGVYPFLHKFLFPLKNWWYGARGTGRKYVVEFTKDIIKSRHLNKEKAFVGDSIDTAVDQDGKALDFLSKFWAKHVKDPQGFTEYHVLACCSANMFSGSDTTAITLSAITYYLTRNQPALAKLRAEIDDFAARGLISDKITFHESLEMPYLQAVIKEAMRLHPALGLPMERWVPKGGATFGGVFFPEGSTVAVSSWVNHRNKEVFGEDAEEFKPERWLTEDKAKLTEMNRHWIPFGVGSRTCFGRHIAFMEISKLVGNFVRRFDLELVNPNTYWQTRNRLFVKPQDYFVRVHVLDWKRSAKPQTIEEPVLADTSVKSALPKDMKTGRISTMDKKKAMSAMATANLIVA